MKALHKHSSATRMGISLHPDSGGVRGAICLRMFYHLHIHVGARRKSSLDQYLVYHLTHAVRRVENREFYRKSVPILANCYVMPVHVLRVHTWGQFRAASAEKIDHLEDALTQTMILDGAAARYVGILCLVANTLARRCAMKVYAVPAKYSLIVVATVAKWNNRLFVVSEEMRRKVSEHRNSMMARWLPKHGTEVSSVGTSVRGSLTVESIFVKRDATHKSWRSHTALDLRTS